jgi:hypothetical protein
VHCGFRRAQYAFVAVVLLDSGIMVSVDDVNHILGGLESGPVDSSSYGGDAISVRQVVALVGGV